MNNWIEIAKRKGYTVTGVSLWVLKHNLNSYSGAKALGVLQSSLFQWLHKTEKDLSYPVCALFRVLNSIDARGGDSTDYL